MHKTLTCPKCGSTAGQPEGALKSVSCGAMHPLTPMVPTAPTGNAGR